VNPDFTALTFGQSAGRNFHLGTLFGGKGALGFCQF
jgi:hypothetical protein